MELPIVWITKPPNIFTIVTNDDDDEQYADDGNENYDVADN